MRITQKILEKKLQILCNLMGKPFGYHMGEWFIDYGQCYGGYIVCEALENGGQHHPLLNKRLRAQHMADALDMAIAAQMVN